MDCKNAFSKENMPCVEKEIPWGPLSLLQKQKTRRQYLDVLKRISHLLEENMAVDRAFISIIWGQITFPE